MVPQIIFFTALVLFLILLVRRFRVANQIFNNASSIATNVGRGMVQAGGRIGGQVLSQVKRARVNIPLVNDKEVAANGAASDQNFWNEEPINDKPELSGFFEDGDEHFKKGELDKAEEFFLKAASRNPADPRIYARLGVIYLQQKNFNDAIESLKVAVKLDKYNPSRHYNLALAYLGNDDRQKATVSAREAITLDPVTKKYRQLLDHLLERK